MAGVNGNDEEAPRNAWKLGDRMIGGQLASHSTGQDCGNEAETQAFKDGIGEGLHSVLDFIPAFEHGGVHV